MTQSEKPGRKLWPVCRVSGSASLWSVVVTAKPSKQAPWLSSFFGPRHRGRDVTRRGDTKCHNSVARSILTVVEWVYIGMIIWMVGYTVREKVGLSRVNIWPYRFAISLSS